MKTLQITTKRKAMAVMIESLFKPVNGRTLVKMKYCTGKYKPDAFPVGRELEVNDNVSAIWVEKRKDSHGPYSSLFCVTTP
jgi:hypothetical protein